MAEKDAETLKNAMKGIGTDEAAIIKVICNRNNDQRQKIKQAFKNAYGKDLISELKSELKGNFEQAVLALFEDPITYDCTELKKAMKGAGTNEDTLIEIIGSRTTQRLKLIKEKYKQLYGKELEQELKGEVSGDLLRLLTSLLQCKRSDDKHVNAGECDKKAKQLYEAGKGQWGTDESVFNKIFTLSSPAELVGISVSYHKLSGKTLIEAVDDEFNGDMQKCLHTILYATISPSEYFAFKMNKAVKGAGTDDDTLIRCIVVRDEIDMPLIKAFYKKMIKKELVDDIKSDCTGDYKNLLVELVSH